MRWRWSEPKRAGNPGRKKSEFQAGGAKFNFILVICALALVGWAVVVIGGPYLRKARLEGIMADWMRDYKNVGEDMMMDQIVSDAQKSGLKQLKREDCTFQGDVGVDSFVHCEYEESIKLPGDRYYVIPMVAEKHIKIPG